MMKFTAFVQFHHSQYVQNTMYKSTLLYGDENVTPFFRGDRFNWNADISSLKRGSASHRPVLTAHRSSALFPRVGGSWMGFWGAILRMILVGNAPGCLYKTNF